MNKAERKVIELLLDVARKAFFAMDSTCDDGNGLHWDEQCFDELSAAMDKLDDLPDDKPDVIMGPATKAEWALRGCFPELINQTDADRIAELERQLAEARAALPTTPQRAIDAWNQRAQPTAQQGSNVTTCPRLNGKLCNCAAFCGDYLRAQSVQASQRVKLTDDMIFAAARALSDENADACNVNKDDNWTFYSDDFYATARIALSAALQEGKEKEHGN